MQTKEPLHPILDQPWSWEITGLQWCASGQLAPSSFLDVTFLRDGTTRRLRFVDPQDLVLELSSPYPAHCGDMVILDIRGRQLDGLGVQATDAGADGTPLRLYARDVTDVSSSSISPSN